MIKRFAAIGCTHAPYTDPKFWAWAMRQIEAAQPDVIIHLGDALDMAAVTHWDDESARTLEQEYDMCNGQFAELRGIAPDAQLIYMLGNHEERMEKPGRVPMAYRSLLNPNRHMPELAHWKTYDYKNDPKEGVFNIGNVSFAHGWSAGPSGINSEAYRFTPEYGLQISAHTHRGHGLQEVNVGTRWARRWKINTGCGIDLTNGLDYMKTNDDDRWSNGIVIGEADTRRLSKPGGWAVDYYEYANKLRCFSPHAKGYAA